MINRLMIDNINMMFKEKDDTYYNKKEIFIIKGGRGK